MTPKPEPEWRPCPCAVKSYRDTPPWAYRWCRLLPCGRVAVSRPTCLACPVPDCAAALREAELQMAWIVTETSDPGPSARPYVEIMNKCHDALAKLRQARNEARTHRKDGDA